MNTENPYNPILEKVLTLEQLNQCTELLRQAYDSLYKNKTDAREIIESTLPYYLAEIVFEIAQKNAVPFTDIKRLQEILDEMRTYMGTLPVAEIVVAFIPTYRNVQKMSQWWEEYTGTHVVLAIQVDESVVAGAKISYAGFYKDYSLSNWLNQNASTNLDQFI